MNYSKKLSNIAQFIFGFVLAMTLIFVPSFATQNDTAQIGQLLQQFGSTQHTSEQTIAHASANKPLAKSTAQAISPEQMVLDSPVMDYAQILNANEKQQLSEQLYKIYQDRLAQVALVIVPTTDGVPIFDYTMAVAKRFGLGQKGVDNGVLIMVAINDRDLFIATGYGVEGVLPDGAISRIIREDIKPSFKNGAYAQGLSAGIARIDERLRADPDTLAQADKQEQNQSPVDVFAFFVPALIIGLFLTNLFGRLLGASIAAGGFAFFAFSAGAGLFGILIAGIVLWLFLLIFARGGIVIGTGNHRGGGNFGNGGGHIGGFGSKGGFSGGGGSFGGGGAGGSW